MNLYSLNFMDGFIVVMANSKVEAITNAIANMNKTQLKKYKPDELSLEEVEYEGSVMVMDYPSVD